MKGINIFCASQSSTAICLSMDPGSSIHLAGRSIDRHNPIIRDGRRSCGARAALPNPPCSSQQSPINPKPYHQLQKTRKSSSKNKKNCPEKPSIDQKKKSVNVAEAEAEAEDVIARPIGVSIMRRRRRRRSFVRQSELFTPSGSTKYLLSDASFFDGLSDYDPVLSLAPLEPKNKKSHQDVSSQSKPSPDQVVVLRVSLHCKGCERKVRKHISRMKGVTSFDIDFAAKKVTITGDVSPASVLASFSQVKSAQFWTTNFS